MSRNAPLTTDSPQTSASGIPTKAKDRGRRVDLLALLRGAIKSRTQMMNRPGTDLSSGKQGWHLPNLADAEAGMHVHACCYGFDVNGNIRRYSLVLA